MPNQLYRLDRALSPFERDDPPHPLEPKNVQITTPGVGINDIRWDDPAELLGNQKFNIIGVNVYRSYDSELSGFERLNVVPVGGNFWRDQTDNKVEVEEDVTNKFIARGEDSVNNRWVLKVENYPIVQPGSQAIPAVNAKDVELKIDGQIVPVLRIYGTTGEIELITAPVFNPVTRKLVQPVLPGPSSTVTVTYTHNRNLVTNKVGQRIFYRLTTMSMKEDGSTLETPLEKVQSKQAFATAELDYIWREAVRRNRWILEQGGERVKVFIRRLQGLPCPCVTGENGICFTMEHHKQPQNDCALCFGTGVLGGFDGPYDIVIAPRDNPREIRQTEMGRYAKDVESVWTSPTPLLSQRDFIVKQNNDRFSIGPVHVPSSRGMVLQQHFDIHMLPESDIIYSVPKEGLSSLAFPLDQLHYNRTGQMPSPEVTEKATIEDHREERGRTPVYENITY